MSGLKIHTIKLWFACITHRYVHIEFNTHLAAPFSISPSSFIDTSIVACHIEAIKFQGGGTQVHAVGRSATAVKVLTGWNFALACD